jgi:kynurenine formamidase
MGRNKRSASREEIVLQRAFTLPGQLSYVCGHFAKGGSMKFTLCAQSQSCRLTVLVLWGLVGSFLLVGVTQAQETPIGPKWWPSEWGVNDQRGAVNRITPQKVLQAASLIKEGKIYQLGRVYERSMPLSGNRSFVLTIPGMPTQGPSGKNQLIGNSEVVAAEIGQVGTQFDGLGHVGVQVDGKNLFYNGNNLSEFGDAYGLKKLGIENVGVIFTRGVLLDVAAYKGVEQVDAKYIVTVEDLTGMLAKQKVEIQEGDVVLFHTGHGRLWMKDNAKYLAGTPGPGISAIKWLTEKKIVMVGADTPAVEAMPGENKDMFVEGHQHLLVRNGIYIHENLDLSELAKDKVYEFVYSFAPLRLKGATGSPGNPFAIR